MIVFEGADLVGKSTIAKATVAGLQAMGYSHILQHMSRLPPSWNHYTDYAAKISTFSVWDRFHMGEIIYRKHDDRPSGMTPMHYTCVDATLTLAGGFVVVVVATPEVIKSRFEDRGDNMYSLERILRVNESYIEIAERRVIESRGHDYRPRVDSVIAVDDPRMDIAGVVSRLINAYSEQLEIVTEVLHHE